MSPPLENRLIFPSPKNPARPWRFFGLGRFLLFPPAFVDIVPRKESVRAVLFFSWWPFPFFLRRIFLLRKKALSVTAGVFLFLKTKRASGLSVPLLVFNVSPRFFFPRPVKQFRRSPLCEMWDCYDFLFFSTFKMDDPFLFFECCLSALIVLNSSLVEHNLSPFRKEIFPPPSSSYQSAYSFPLLISKLAALVPRLEFFWFYRELLTFLLFSEFKLRVTKTRGGSPRGFCSLLFERFQTFSHYPTRRRSQICPFLFCSTDARILFSNGSSPPPLIFFPVDSFFPRYGG